MTTTNTTTVELSLGGMTCASCAARIEKRLNKLDGVEAKVNYATETASVTAADVPVDVMIDAVASIGYTASIVTPTRAATDGDQTAVVDEHELRMRGLRDRLVVCTVLTIPVLALSMIPRLQFDSWQWLCFALAAPVVVWGALPFHKAAWANLRHAAATMDTLISLGTIAAFTWSVWALFIGNAGDPTMRMPFNITPSAGSGTDELYLEVASVVTVFILAGRYFEARAKRRAGAALRALLELGAKDAHERGPRKPARHDLPSRPCGRMRRMNASRAKVTTAPPPGTDAGSRSPDAPTD